MIRPVAADGRIDAGGVFTPILRPRVLERISSAAMQRIVLIVAAAGYGKSVALRQYLSTLRDPVVRYDVRPEHANLLGFVRGFADAVLGIAPDARETVSRAYNESRTSSTQGVDLAMWMHAHIKTFTGVIAIDDLHIAEHAQISKFLVSLIERTRGRARWIIASRSSLDLPVGSWLAYGEMDLNVDDHDLRFTVEEARQAAKLSRVGVRDGELEELLRMTQGWPTALSFALRTSTRSIDLRNISASTREMVYRYLAEQVYSILDEDERELLRFIAYLPDVHVHVLRHAGYSKARALVERLRERVAFIYADTPDLYRCHDLFRDFLQHEVQLQGDAAVHAIQCRVGRALESAKRLPAALSAFTAAGATEHILRLLEVCGFDLMEQAHGDIVQDALEGLPQDVRSTNPTVLALRALSASNSGRLDRAEALFGRALRQCVDNSLKATIAISLGLLRINQGEDAVPLLQSAIDDDVPPHLHAEILALTAAAFAYTRRSREAERALEEAETCLDNVESDEVRARILQHMGAAALHLELPFERVFDLLTRASSLASAWGTVSRALLFLGIASELYEDDSAKSVWYAQQAVTAGLKAGARTAVQAALLQVMHIETLRGNADRLQSLEQQFIATSTTDSARMGYIMPARAALASWQGRFGEARRAMAMVAASSHFDFDRAFDGAMHAMYLVADGERAQALAVVARTLEDIEVAQFRYLHGKRFGEVARLLCAIVEALAGRVTKANRILQRPTQQAPPFLGALREVALSITRAMKTPALHDDICASLEQLTAVGYGGVSKTIQQAVARAAHRVESNGKAVLTRAEIDILQALADGHSPKDIALESGRSVNTVQVHIQNVIRKLGCSGRDEALRIARRQSLLQ